MFQIRTDLAVETSESRRGEKDVSGFRVETSREGDGIVITKVCIETQKAAKTLGKPRGTYISIEADQMMEEDAGYHREISDVFSRQLKQFLPEDYNNRKILIVGLGNREVTPDALGPLAAGNLCITRHLEPEGQTISAIVPGVMAQTGMESLEIIKGVVNETKPDVVLTVDALAARSMKRLGRTIQLTDTGIVPGSGVGNHRNAINKENLGVPVISIGIPTVVDAATIVADAVNANREMTEKIMSPQLNGMFVTPKNIDDTIKQLGFLVSEGLNIAFSKE